MWKGWTGWAAIVVLVLVVVVVVAAASLAIWGDAVEKGGKAEKCGGGGARGCSHGKAEMYSGGMGGNVGSLRYTPVVSRVNGKSYYVLRDALYKEEAADVLANVDLNLQKFMEALEVAPLRNERPEIQRAVHRLVKLFPKGQGIKLYELNFEENSAFAVTHNKTEGLALCVRRDTDTQQIGNVEVITYISIHELAHSAKEEYEPMADNRSVHGAEFRAIERYFHNFAHRIGIIPPPGSIVNSQFCGKFIPEPVVGQ